MKRMTDHFIGLYLSLAPVASLGLESPGAVTHGVTPWASPNYISDDLCQLHAREAFQRWNL